MSENQLIKLVPNFVDKALEEPAREIGRLLGNIFYSVFSPINFPMEKYRIRKTIELEQYEEDIRNEINNILPENLIEPLLNIVGPALEASKYYISNEDHRKMFAKLIARSMDKETTDQVHPSFIEIIKQINSDEAKILKLLNHYSVIPIIDVQGILKTDASKFASTLKDFSLLPYQANCEIPENGTSYIGNLHRLGLIEISYTYFAHDMNSYNELYNHPRIIKEKQIFERIDYILDIKKRWSKKNKIWWPFL